MGGRRPLGIPTVRDRVAQPAAKLVLEPIFEADFLPCSYGFRPQAVGDAGDGAAAYSASSRGYCLSRSSISATSSARSTMTGCWPGGAAGVGSAGAQADPPVAAGGCDDDAALERTVAGTPQGGVISPLLANIYLHVLDTELVRAGWASWCATPTTAWCCAGSRGAGRGGPGRGRGHPGRARAGAAPGQDEGGRPAGRPGGPGFPGLSLSGPACRGGCGSSKRIVRYYLHRWPSQRAMKRLRGRSGTGPVATVSARTSAT